jgi:hypothetical protein
MELLLFVVALLCNDAEVNNKIRPSVGSGQWKATKGRCFLYGLCRDVISRKVQEPGLPGWGSFKNRDNKICSWVPWDSDLRQAELAMPSKNWKLQTRLLVRQDAPHQQNSNCLKIIEERRGKICSGSQMGTGHQDRSADWPSIVI